MNKREYIEAITEMLERTPDMKLVYYVFALLKKALERAS